MNPFVLIMLICAAIGLLDKMLGGPWGLGRAFDNGLAVMGGMALSMIGLYCIGITVIQQYSEQIAAALTWLPFDPALLIACLLPPDMGGYPMSMEIARDPAVGLFFAALITPSLGTVIGYQLPVFLGAIGKEDIQPVLKGLFIGVGVLPPGLLLGGLLLRVPLGALLLNLLPVTVICVVLIAALTFAERPTTRILQAVGVVIKILSYVLSALLIVDLYVTDLHLVAPELRNECFTMVFQVTVVISGALVLSQLVNRYCHRPLAHMAKRLGVNEYAVMGLMLGAVNSLAMLPLLPRMDTKGKLLNGAFSAAASYTFGGQMAFVAGSSNGMTTAVFMVTKLLCGVLGVLVACLLARRKPGTPATLTESK